LNTELLLGGHFLHPVIVRDAQPRATHTAGGTITVEKTITVAVITNIPGKRDLGNGGSTGKGFSLVRAIGTHHQIEREEKNDGQQDHAQRDTEPFSVIKNAQAYDTACNDESIDQNIPTDFFGLVLTT
jgi:hypothetical protein